MPPVAAAHAASNAGSASGNRARTAVSTPPATQWSGPERHRVSAVAELRERGCVVRLGPAHRDDQGDREMPLTGGEVGEKPQRFVVRPLRVVDDHGDRRAPGVRGADAEDIAHQPEQAADDAVDLLGRELDILQTPFEECTGDVGRSGAERRALGLLGRQPVTLEQLDRDSEGKAALEPGSVCA